MGKNVYRAAFIGEKYVQIKAEEMEYFKPVGKVGPTATKVDGSRAAVILCNHVPGRGQEIVAIFPDTNLLGVVREDSVVFPEEADAIVEAAKADFDEGPTVH